MLLSAGTLRRLIYSYKWLFKPETVLDYEEREDFIEGSSFDLSIAKLYMPNPIAPAIIGDKIRKTPDALELLPKDLQDPSFNDYFMKSGLSKKDRKKMTVGWHLGYLSYHIIQSNEYTQLPATLLGRLRQRRTYIVSGCPVFLTDVAPEFGGNISCGITVLHKAGLILERNARFCCYRFEQFDTEETDGYRGIYGGKMVGSEGVKRGY